MCIAIHLVRFSHTHVHQQHHLPLVWRHAWIHATSGAFEASSPKGKVRQFYCAAAARKRLHSCKKHGCAIAGAGRAVAAAVVGSPGPAAAAATGATSRDVAQLTTTTAGARAEHAATTATTAAQHPGTAATTAAGCPATTPGTGSHAQKKKEEMEAKLREEIGIAIYWKDQFQNVTDMNKAGLSGEARSPSPSSPSSSSYSSHTDFRFCNYFM